MPGARTPLIDPERTSGTQRGAHAHDSEYDAQIIPIDHVPYCENAELLVNTADWQRPKLDCSNTAACRCR
jgi:hypothetical protein